MLEVFEPHPVPHVHAAELVVAEARVRQRKCEAYQLFVDLTSDLLESISDAAMS